MRKLPFRDNQNNVLDETSADAINEQLAIHKTSRRNVDLIYRWSKEWHKDNLVENRSQDEINNHTLLIVKCMNADKDFKLFYSVR